MNELITAEEMLAALNDAMLVEASRAGTKEFLDADGTVTFVPVWELKLRWYSPEASTLSDFLTEQAYIKRMQKKAR